MSTLRSRTHAVIAGLAIAVLPTLLPASASAQNFFDFFNFGGRSRSAPPPAASPYADPNADTTTEPQSGAQRQRAARSDSGPSVSYCVRLCDGRYFPIQRAGDASPAQVCSSFCPTSRTKVFAGSAIDAARARDGTRYSDIANAFVYRKRVVDGCTCNGKDAFGLVDMKAADDPTLRPGDVVATDQGFVAYEGGRKRAEFTPIERSGSRLSSELRRRLAQTGIVPAPQAAQPQPAEPSTVGRGGSDDVKERSVQRGK
jgi:uncharacterized protein DUF2865